MTTDHAPLSAEMKKAVAEIRDALKAGSWQGRAIKKLDAAYEACRRLDNYDATDGAWDEPAAPLSAEKPDRYHLLDEAPFVVRTTEGERSLGVGWLVISEAEYAALIKAGAERDAALRLLEMSRKATALRDMEFRALKAEALLARSRPQDDTSQREGEEPTIRSLLEWARQELCLVIAYIGRDQGTDRIDATLNGLVERLVKIDAKIGPALRINHSAHSAAPPVERGEAVGIAGTMPGTSGFTMAAFKAEEVPVGTPLYTHPAAPVAPGRGEVLGEARPRPGSEWTEDDGNVLWFHYPICEPPWVGSPVSEDFDEDWYQWWTPLPNGNAIDAAIRALKSTDQRGRE